MHVKRYHHIFDIENCNENIGNRNAIRSFLEELTTSVDMHILEGPIIAEGIESNPGISGIAIIDFSHISVHTFTSHHEALVDIFSCKPYNREIVFEHCKKFFGVTDADIRRKEVWWG